MNFFEQIFSNRIFWNCVVCWAAAQLFKFLIDGLLNHHLDWRRFFGMGGMPSSHSALVTGLMLMCGIQMGFDSAAFAISATLAMIVIYDALGVRRETGKQGQAINLILRELIVDGKPLTDEKLKELVGHTPVEVIGGVITGMLITGIMVLV